MNYWTTDETELNILVEEFHILSREQDKINPQVVIVSVKLTKINSSRGFRPPHISIKLYWD